MTELHLVPDEPEQERLPGIEVVAQPVVPLELRQVTDRLFDHGHVALAHLVLNEHAKFQRLLHMCDVLMAEVDPPDSAA